MSHSLLQESARALSPATDIESRLLYAAYKRKPLNLLLTFSVALLIGGLFWPRFPPAIVTLWVVTMVIVVGLGYLECTAFKRATPKAQDISRWKRVFLSQSIAGGASWALGPCLLIPGASGPELTLFVTILLAVCAVAMTSITEQRTAMISFVSSVALPPALILWSVGGDTVDLIALALVTGTAFFILVGRDLHRTMRNLLESESRTHAILDTSLDAIIEMNTRGEITDWNPRAELIFGLTKTQALGLLLDETIIPLRDRRSFRRGLDSLAVERTEYELNRRIERTAIRNNGAEFPVEMTVTALQTGLDWCFTVFIADLTERKQAEEALRIAATAFESQQGMFITDTHYRILRVNQAFTEITGYSAEDVLGENPRLLSSGRHDASFYAMMWGAIEHQGSWQGEIWNKRKNGDIFPALISISAVNDANGQTSHYVCAFTDISSRKSAEDEIEYLAFYDPLTRLPNRRLLLDRLQRTLSTSVRRLKKSALLFVDLDNFKLVNDTLGHRQGDLLLGLAAKRLTSCVRDGDTVARVGGDEFVVMLDDLSENELEAATQAKAIGEKVLKVLNRSYPLDGCEQHSTPSIGVTLFGGDPKESSDAPLKRAEMAMYQSKTAGRNTVSFYDPQMQVEMDARAALEADLREAIQKEQFVLYYQAQVMGAGRLTGAEGLLRWLHPERGLVSPGAFIGLAEETGLIVPMGQWVLETACKQLATWAKHAECSRLTVSVNVSARQFHSKDFVDHVLGTIERTGANPNLLKLELTESLMIKDVEAVIAKMSALKARGVCFSMDDFGTGYSSLTYLKRLPLDQLKIDQGFVKNILVDPNDAAIAKMIVALAESLGLTVIAEGVELEAQRDFLAHQGCHAYQGYFFGRPMPVADFEAMTQKDTL